MNDTVTKNSDPITVTRFVRNQMLYIGTHGFWEHEGVDNLGGISLIFNVNYRSAQLKVHWSVCRDDENFCKRMGLEMARGKLPLYIPYDQKCTLVQNLIDYLNSVTDLPKEFQALQRNLNKNYTPQAAYQC
jgi:hypothetical protein